MKTATMVVMILSAAIPADAQPLSMAGRASLEVNFGFWSGGASNTIIPGGIQAEVGAGSFIGGLQATYWFKEYAALTVSAGLLSGKITSTVNILSANQQVSSVAPVLLGVRYYALGSDADGEVRPYLSAAAGPYVGSQTTNRVLSQESRTESVFGGRIGAGVDFFLGDHFKLGAGGGYNLMGDFSEPLGGRTNYNGGDFSIGAGYLF